MVGLLIAYILASNRRKPESDPEGPDVGSANPVRTHPTRTTPSVCTSSSRKARKSPAQTLSPLILVGILLSVCGLATLPRTAQPKYLDGSILVFAPFTPALFDTVRTMFEVTPFEDRPWETHLQVTIRSSDDKAFPFIVVASGIYQFQPDCTPIATSLFGLAGGSSQVIAPNLLQCTSPGGTVVGTGPSVPDWTYRISTVKQQDMVEKVNVGPIGFRRGPSQEQLQSDVGSKALESFRDHIAVGSSTAAWATGQDYQLHADPTVPSTYSATFDFYGQSLNRGYVSSRLGRTYAGPIGRPDGANVTGYPSERTTLPIDSSTAHISGPTEAGSTVTARQAAWVALRSESTTAKLGPIALPEYIRSASPASASSADLAWTANGPLDRGITWEIGSRTKEGHDQWLTFIAGVLTALGGSACLSALQVYVTWRAETQT